MLGLMADSTKESGLIIIWKELECILGLMEGGTKVSTKMTKSMDMESILGLTRGSTKDGGIEESNME